MKKKLIILIMVTWFQSLADFCHAVIYLQADGSGDYSTIQDAITAASLEDEIICYPGTYTGVGNRGINFLGKSIILKAESAEFQSGTIIDPEGMDRAFTFTTGETSSAKVVNLSIRNGRNEYGGAVYCFDASPCFQTCSFQNNEAGVDGGAFYGHGSQSQFINCSFSNNSAIGSGGAVFATNGCTSEFIGCEFIGNTAVNGAGMYISGGDQTYLNCSIEGNTATGMGGGMYLESTSLRIFHLQIYTNSANLKGGGIYIDGGTVVLFSNSISANSSIQGGGVYATNGAEIDVIGTEFEENYAESLGGAICDNNATRFNFQNSYLWGNSTDGSGGHLSLSGNGTKTISNSWVYKGCATNGGAFHIQSVSDLTIIHSELIDNSASGAGGALSIGTSTGIKIYHSILAGNSATEGGGLSAYDSEVYLSNGSLEVNSSTEAGGAVQILAGSLEVRNSLFAGNESLYCGAIILEESDSTISNTTFADNSSFSKDLSGGACLATSNSTITATNSIFWENQPNQTESDSSSTISITYSCYQGGFGYPADHNILEDPLFVDGFYLENAARAVSPCIDTGSGAASSISHPGAYGDVYLSNQSTDIDGSVDTGIVDMGFHPRRIIHVPADFVTIQAAIDTANCGDTIEVADGSYSGSGNKNLSLSGKTIKLRSENGADQCTIDAESSGYGFHIFSGESTNTEIQGFTIKNASSGGICVTDYSSPLFVRCTVTQNHVTTSGGGLVCNRAAPTMRLCSICDNSASESGGGIHGEESFFIIDDCNLSGNSAGFSGGAINCIRSAPTILYSRFESNSTANNGAGMNVSRSHPFVLDSLWRYNTATTGTGINCIDHSNLFMRNCLIAENTASATGAAVNCCNASCEIYNSTVANNTAGVGGWAIDCDQCPKWTLQDSVVWGNEPGQMLVSDSLTNVSYCDVLGGFSGSGNIDADPLFVAGPFGDYYLSRTITGHPQNTPCLNAGSAYAADIYTWYEYGRHSMADFTTRTDEVPDTGIIDLGYHWPASLPSRGWISGYVQLERGSTTPPDPSWSIPVEIALCLGNSTQAIFPADTDESGYFSVEVWAGTYTVTVKNRHTLTRRLVNISVPVDDEIQDLDFGTLPEGDADNDNTVTSVDFFLLRDSYNHAEGDLEYDDRADFNEDGIVTSVDFFLMRNHYNEAGEECSG